MASRSSRPVGSAAGLGLTALAGAAAVAGYAFYKGDQEQRKFSEALITTGNYAGRTTDSLDAMAHAAVAGGGSLGQACRRSDRCIRSV